MPLARDLADQPGASDVEASEALKGSAQLPLTDSEFNFFRDLAKMYAGIKIADYKRNMVFRRISKRLNELGMNSVSDYCRLVAGDDGPSELPKLINALTTNKTGFFREKHHFDHLAMRALPSMLKDCEARDSRRLRFWSAGCSSGQEPYSIAMTLQDSVPDLQRWDARILATDIDTDMIEHGRSGIYPADETKAIPPKARSEFAQPVAGDKTHRRMADVIRSRIDYRQLNLLGPWPMQGPFDAIFCRNVVIYFDKPTQRVLFDRFADMLRDGCFLYVGHAESLYKVTERFCVVGQSIYRKLA